MEATRTSLSSFKKIWCTYTHHGILLRHKNKILQFAAKWMDLENMLSERCLGRGIRADRGKQILAYQLYENSKILK